MGLNFSSDSPKQRKAAYNSTYKKLAVQWLNEALCFVSSFVVAGSLVLPYRQGNRQLLVAAKCQFVNKLQLKPFRIKN